MPSAIRRHLVHIGRRWETGRQSIGWEKLDEVVEVLVENAFLTTEVVLDGDAECLDEIDDGLLLEEGPRLSLLYAVCLSRDIWHDIFGTRVRRAAATLLMGAHTWHVEPHDTRKSPAAEDNRRPESTTLVVPFETGGSTIRDDEAEHGTQSKRRGLIRRLAR